MNAAAEPEGQQVFLVERLTAWQRVRLLYGFLHTADTVAAISESIGSVGDV